MRLLVFFLVPHLRVCTKSCLFSFIDAIMGTILPTKRMAHMLNKQCETVFTWNFYQRTHLKSHLFNFIHAIMVTFLLTKKLVHFGISTDEKKSELNDLVEEAAQNDGRLARRPLKDISKEIQAHLMLLSVFIQLIEERNAIIMVKIRTSSICPYICMICLNIKQGGYRINSKLREKCIWVGLTILSYLIF